MLIERWAFFLWGYQLQCRAGQPFRLSAILRVAAIRQPLSSRAPDALVPFASCVFQEMIRSNCAIFEWIHFAAMQSLICMRTITAVSLFLVLLFSCRKADLGPGTEEEPIFRSVSNIDRINLGTVLIPAYFDGYGNNRKEEQPIERTIEKWGYTTDRNALFGQEWLKIWDDLSDWSISPHLPRTYLLITYNKNGDPVSRYNWERR